MQRDSQAFLLDVVDAGEAILEEEFILIGEALANLARVDPALFTNIDHGRQIISFRNKLSHDYPHCQQRSPLGLTRPPGGPTDDHATAL